MTERLRIGRYEVLSRLSTGGMAELFLAFVAGPGGFRKLVALKRILPSLKDEDEFVEMFLEEARISASLSHANIAQVFELGEADGEFFLALEFIEGQDLGRIARRAARAKTRLPAGFSVAVAHDVALGLHYAHSFTTPSGKALPVVHRDLKPGNVMLTYGGGVKLIDFGIAKARGSVHTTEAGRVKGSVAYMSPEQVRGDVLDGRSDLFAVGTVLYELLTGTRAFAGADEAATMYRVLTATPPPPSDVAGVPAALSAVVLRALEKDRDARFQTGSELAAALESAAPAFSEEQRAQWMRATFAAEMEFVRRIFLAAEDADTEQVRAAAGLLGAQVQQEGGSSVGGSRSQRKEVTAAPVPAQAAQDTTVLVVDDTRVGRLVVKSVLATEGFRVVEAESGEEALEILGELRPDLIILDVRMPGIDGFETCQRLRSRPELRRCPVVFLSAACGIDERARGLEVGGDDFLRKPFEAGDLLTRVRTYLHRAASLAPRPPAAAGG